MVTGFRKAAAMMSPDFRDRSLVEYSAIGGTSRIAVRMLQELGVSGKSTRDCWLLKPPDVGRASIPDASRGAGANRILD